MSAGREAELGGRLVEGLGVLGLGQLRVALLGSRLVRERQLQDAALLRHVVGALGGVVGGLHLLVGHLHPLHGLLARHEQQVGLALLRGLVLALVLLEERLELVLGRLGNRDELGKIGGDVLDDALLVAEAIERIDRGTAAVPRPRPGSRSAAGASVPASGATSYSPRLRAPDWRTISIYLLISILPSLPTISGLVPLMTLPTRSSATVMPRSRACSSMAAPSDQAPQRQQGQGAAPGPAWGCGRASRRPPASRWCRPACTRRPRSASCRRGERALLRPAHEVVADAPEGKGDDQEPEQQFDKQICDAPSHCIEHGIIPVSWPSASGFLAVPSYRGRRKCPEFSGLPVCA